MPRRRLPYAVRVRSGSSFWQYRLSGWTLYRPSPVKVRYRSGRPSNRAEAESWAAEEWKRTGDNLTAHGPTLRAFLAPYFIPGLCPHLSRVLADRGRYSAKWAKEQRKRLDRYVLPDPLAALEVTAIRPGHIEDWKLRLRTNPLSNRTVNIILSALKTCLAEGYHRGEIPNNPGAGVSKIRDDSRETGIFSVEELRLIFSTPGLFAARETNLARIHGILPHDLARAFFITCAATGERPSAILSLRWQDVSGDVLTFTRTKTTSGRQIPVIPAVVQALETLQAEALRTEGSDLVFAHDDGTPCGVTWYRKRFQAMLARAGLPATDTEGRRRIPYSLKHSLITHLIDAGADEVLVREYVGHSHGYGATRVMTRVQATYKHRQAERLRELLPWIERLIG